MARHIITPEGVINFYKGIDINHENQRIFKTKKEQSDYFAKKLAFRLDKYTNITGGVVRIQKRPSALYGAKYLSFTNPGIDQVTYYASVLAVNYVNNETVDIIYKIDWFQTFMFDFEVDECNIEREHLSEYEYRLAKENPFRADIKKLGTQEALTADPLDEVFYTESTENKPGNFRTLGTKKTAVVLYFTPPTFMNEKYEGKTAETPVGSGGGSTPATPPGWEEESDWRKVEGRGEQFRTLFDPKLRGGPVYEGEDTRLYGYFNAESFDDVASYSWVAWEVIDPKRKSHFINEIVEFFTYYGITSSILSLQYVPEELLHNEALGLHYKNKSLDKRGGSETVLVSSSDVKDNKRDPKLSRFPFQYMRVVSPDGAVKEYMYERAMSLVAGEASHFHLVSSLASVPTQMIVPYNYGENVAGSINEREGANLREAIIFRNFPHAPFMIDGYLSHVAQQNQQYLLQSNSARRVRDASIIKKNEYNKANWMSDTVIKGVGGIAKQIASLPGVLMGDFSALNMGQQTVRDIELEKIERTAMIEDERAIREARGAWAKGRYITDSVYADAKKAININEYMEGDPATASLIFRQLNFKIYFTKLQDEVLNEYDKYLKKYGYRADTFAKPLVFNFIKGKGAAPHFENVGGKKSTYCRTRDIRVVAPTVDAEREIAALFNGGCSFIYG